MTAITAMQKEITKIDKALAQCVTELGYVKTGCRYRYNLLVRKKRDFRESIEWMQAQK